MVFCVFKSWWLSGSSCNYRDGHKRNKMVLTHDEVYETNNYHSIPVSFKYNFFFLTISYNASK